MKKWKGLKIAVCQMKVVPGRPDINANYMIGEIIAAGKNGADVIVFPELCVPGYLIGDYPWEDDCFVKDVQVWNERICQATQNGIIAIFGSVAIQEGAKGKDGRLRKFNAAFVAQNGKLAGKTVKTLQPNYRMFDDDRHFFSICDIRNEEGEACRTSISPPGNEFLGVHNYLRPFWLETRVGKVPIGVILCEDMWHDDYPFNPTKSLVQNGTEIVFNLSASPWTWQKNQKRHRVVKELISECQVPFVYVNNTGIQTIGKNIVIFDGSSTVYNKNGDIIFEVSPYADGTFCLKLNGNMPVLCKKPQDDAKELFLALKCAAVEFFKTMPPAMRKVVVGLSGGIDSALTAAFYAYILGPENVVGINMPSKFNSSETKSIAAKIVANLDIAYKVTPIQEIVDLIAKATNTPEGSLSYENIQARVRMEILAAEAQNRNCVFSCNSNKVEMAFGYGTLCGDIAGFLALIADLKKLEVYQLSEYLNRVIYGRDVIPQECFKIKASAELALNQADPFDYGNLLTGRGYHDEMVRAFVEFLRNPEWFLEKYIDGALESELKLQPGRLNKLFPTSRDFVEDLEKNWRRFFASFFKREKAPFVPIVTKRAFGYDLRESVISAHFTERYKELRSKILEGSD